MSLLLAVWHVVRFIILAGIALLLAAAIGEFIRQLVRPKRDGARADLVPALPTPTRPPEAPDLRHMRPGAHLRELRDTISRKELLERLEDLRLAIAEAHAALTANLPNAVDVAAARLARCRWATGAAWRRFLSEIGESNAGSDLARAMAHDVSPIAGELARRLAMQPGAAMAAENGGPALGCAACGRAAVTFHVSEKGVRASTLSPVNPGPTAHAEPGQQLAALLKTGDARGVVAFLVAPGGPGCDAYCPQCDRVYCKDHYAVEAKWSGSWHEATDVTCPMGHHREIE